MYEALVSGRTTFDVDAVFVQSVPARPHYVSPNEMPLHIVKKMRTDFIKQCRIDNLQLPAVMRFRANMLLASYADRKVWPRRRLRRRQIWEAFFS